MEVGAFFHFGLKTCLHTSNPGGQAPASGFNPSARNAEQWILTAKSMGAKYAVLTARHEDGFCLWPNISTSITGPWAWVRTSY
jgi:alpha-L-fucosidase